MKQENCRPCQGIQFLTPVLNRNLPGQTGLRYRVGRYPEFFESMLAALSRGTLSRNPSPQELEQTVLRHLTARESDDPSIAMLDAWAVLADVLTFYNERYANEAYLRTAIQSSSLFELANMVGYTPRPGLSSSVYLAFEVDDKSNSVLIQGGTQAKSTPIPGTGQSAETFETNDDFVARPSLNKLSPRLTRPQQLARNFWQNLDRIYLKGTGLRISPNDYLTITSSDGGESIPFRVGQIEERTSSLERYTVVYLQEDDMTPKRLLQVVRQKVLSFVRTRELTNLLDDTYVNELRDSKKSKLLTLVPINSQTLEDLDRICQSGVLRALLDDKQSPRSDLLKINQKLRDDAMEFELGATFENAIKAFQLAHDTATVDDWRIKVADITIGSEASKAAKRVKSIFELCEANEHQVWVAVQPSKKRKTLPGQLFEGDIEAINVPTVSSAKIEVEASDDFKQSVRERNNGAVFTTIEEAFQNWEIDSWTVPDKQLVFWKLRIRGDHSNEIIRYGVTGVGNGTSSSHFFEELNHDRIVLGDFENNDCLVDPNMSMVCADGDIEYRVNVEAVGGPDGSILSKMSIPSLHGQALNQALSNVKLSNVVSPILDGIYTIKYTVLKDSNKVAFAVRTLIVNRSLEPKPLNILNQISAALDRFHSPDTEIPFGLDRIVNAIQAAVEPCQEISNATSLKADTLLQMSLCIDNQVRMDLVKNQEQKFFGALNSIRVQQLGRFDSSEENRYLGRDYYAQRTAFEPDSPTDGNSQIGYTSSPSQLSAYQDNCGKRNRELSDLQRKASSLIESFETCGRHVLADLLKRRVFFLEKLDLAFRGTRSSLSQAEQVSVENRLIELKAKIDELVKCKDAPCTSISLWDTIVQNDCSLANVKALVNDSLTPANLLPEWQKIVEIFSPNAPPQDQTSSDPFEQILSGTDALSSEGLGTAALAQLIQHNAAVWPQVAAALEPSLRERVFSEFEKFRNERAEKNDVWVFRSSANIFGWNSSGQQKVVGNQTPEILRTLLTKDDIFKAGMLIPNSDLESSNRLFLDGKFSRSSVGSPILISNPRVGPKVFTIGDVAIAPRSRYFLSSDCTRIELAEQKSWWTPTTDRENGEPAGCGNDSPARNKDGFFVIQNTKVYCDAEKMDLADEILEDSMPIASPDPNATTTKLTLDLFSPELEVAAPVIISGKVASQSDRLSPNWSSRTLDTSIASELCKIIRVKHSYDKCLFNDSFRTEIEVSPALRNSYWTTSVSINANVVEATHGETVPEVLGSGDSRRPFQKFTLSRKPITRLSAPYPSGKREALEVKVNSTTWDQTSQLVDSDPQDEVFELRGNRSDAASHIQFGNGLHGSRLPTGIENVKAIYRVGLGKAGNVQPGQINQLPSPPFGVKSVINPFPGDGGANADTIYQTRLRIPQSAASIDRLVSKKDFESFAMLFAGIDKVSVVEENGNLKLYIASNTPAPISKNGQLYRNFTEALSLHGDEYGQIEVESHNGLLLHLQAGVRIDVRYDWDNAKREIEARLLKRFGYPSMRMGQKILASEVVETIQSVEHVRYVSLVRFVGLSSGQATNAPDSSRLMYSPDAKENAGAALTLPQAITVMPYEVCYIDDVVTSTVQLERLA